MTLPPAFFVGANLPWIHYGGDFGANAWAPAGLSQHPEPERIASLFDTLRAHGVTTIRWFLLCDGRAGVRLARTACPTASMMLSFAMWIPHWRGPSGPISACSLCCSISTGACPRGWSTASSWEGVASCWRIRPAAAA